MNSTNKQTPDAVVQRVIHLASRIPNVGHKEVDQKLLLDMQKILLSFAKFLVDALPNSNGLETIQTVLNNRSLIGIAKYETTLQDADLSKDQVLQHAVEELLDCANYLEKLLELLNTKNNE